MLYPSELRALGSGDSINVTTAGRSACGRRSGSALHRVVGVEGQGPAEVHPHPPDAGVRFAVRVRPISEAKSPVSASGWIRR